MRRALLILAACGGKSEEPPPAPIPPPPADPADAGIDGITTIPGFDPNSGMHLDEDPSNGKTPTAGKKRTGPPIGIVLKSDPAGAKVYVDGELLGQTPKYWAGMADGSEREFAFTYPGYALARYRFVPITNGTLHASLEAVVGDTPDGGLEPLIAPKLAPDAAIVPPPPTVLTPVDAAPKAVTPDAAEVAPVTDAATPPPD